MKKILWVSILFAATMCAYGQNGRFLQPIFDEVTATYAIEYSEAYRIGATDLTTLYLDFYEPANDTMSFRPIVITVFGGAFVIGSRSQIDMTNYADSLARLGYVVASIDYRLLPFLQLSAQNFIREGYAAAQDINAAIRFCKANYQQYRIDTNQVFLLGNSAGSIASLYALYLDDDERPAETYLDPDMGNLNATGFEQYAQNSGSVAGVISQWGGVADLNIIKSDDNAPVCLIHGTADETVPFESGTSNLLATLSPVLYGSHPISLRLDSLGIEHELHPFEGEEHAFYFTSTYMFDREKFDTCFHITRDFLARHNAYLVGTPTMSMPEITLSLYPNPASDLLHIHLQGHEGQDFQGIIYTANGTVVKTFAMNEPDKTISIQDLPSGVWILALKNGKQIKYQKFIKK